MKAHRIVGPWKLSELAGIERNGLTVFSCFHGGGGSSMGYKLAGFTVLGGVEIDPKMMNVYRQNHHPKHSFLMSLQDFNKLPDSKIPPELFKLDVLDGSPPCSVFSTAGLREKKWGSEHHFTEGQVKQRLDNLFFDFIETGKRLQPRVIIAENVKGLIIGKARGFVKQIFKAFDEAGYTAQLFLLNSSTMGVPQVRERVFFIATRKDIGKEVSLAFNEQQIPIGPVIKDADLTGSKPLTLMARTLWKKTKPGHPFSDADPRGFNFGRVRLNEGQPTTTLIANNGLTHFKIPRSLGYGEVLRVQSFPDDYKAMSTRVDYICGMSVPPFMTQRLALEVGRQIFGVDYDKTIENRIAKEPSRLSKGS